MQDGLHEAKRALRAQVQAALAKIPPEARRVAAGRARKFVTRQDIWQNASSFLSFRLMPSDRDIWPLIEDGLNEGKTTVFPQFDVKFKRYVACRVEDLNKNVTRGYLRVREPLEHCVKLALNRLD